MTDTARNRRGYRFRGQWRTTLRQQVFAIYGPRCVFCGWVGTDGKGAGLQMAHLVDHDAGGSDSDPNNFRPMCAGDHAKFDAEKRRQRRAAR